MVRIGQLAALAGCDVETIRYYERTGVIDKPARTPAGYRAFRPEDVEQLRFVRQCRAHGTIRRYSPETLRRLRFIRRAQGLGFTLDEMGALLALSDGEHCAETRVLGEAKLALVQRKLDELAAIRKALDKLVSQCAQGSRGKGCPLIDALAREAA